MLRAAAIQLLKTSSVKWLQITTVSMSLIPDKSLLSAKDPTKVTERTFAIDVRFLKIVFLSLCLTNFSFTIPHNVQKSVVAKFVAWDYYG